jgi:hypothetical protein
MGIKRINLRDASKSALIYVIHFWSFIASSSSRYLGRWRAAARTNDRTAVIADLHSKKADEGILAFLRKV